ncbi:MAG: Ig-like domain-containing protein, partial [Bosea sp. (in: a-proteobacteria)]
RGLERQVQDHKTWEDIIFKLDRQLGDVLPRDGSLTWRQAAAQSEHLNTSYDSGKIGRGLEHLPPLPGERYLFQSDSRLHLEVAGVDSEATDPRLVATDDALKSAGVGFGIRHLPPQPDGERPNIFNERRTETNTIRTTTLASDERARPTPPEALDDRYRMAEDGILRGNLFDNDRTINGTRDVKVVNPPAVGTLELREDGSFTFTPPADFSGTLTFTYAFTDLRTGQTVEAVATIIIDPVVDAPRVGVATPSFGAEEDTAIALTGLSVGLSDRDGSETLAVRLTGVPEGASFGGLGQNLGNGIWAFTPAEIASGLTFVPPLHGHGTYNLVLQATATETATGASATTTRPFSITIDAQADAPTLTTGTTRANEDTSLGFGRDISYGLVDRDGSERVSRVQLSGFPNDVTVTYTTAAGAFVSLVDGVYSITGSEAAIRATLDSFAAQRPAHRDGDFQISVSVQTADADGSTASTSGMHRLIVDAVADAPAVTGGAIGLEDTIIPVPVTVDLVDKDGSERLAFVEISGIP